MKSGLLLLIFLCINSGLFSNPLDRLIDENLAGQLKEGEFVTETQIKNPQLKLLPRHDELRQYVTNVKNELDPGIIVETLFLYRKPAAALSSGWDTQRAGIFNQIIALSTLTGIEYYSASRDAMRTFYESSFVIDNPSDKNPLPDPFFTRPPASLTLYARQKDLTFGDNIYRYDYVTVQEAFFFTQENLTALTAGIIPAIRRNRLRSVLAIIDCDESLLIYAASMANTAALPGMGDRISASFGNRAEAILKWFTIRADKVLSF